MFYSKSQQNDKLHDLYPEKYLFVKEFKNVNLKKYFLGTYSRLNLKRY